MMDDKFNPDLNYLRQLCKGNLENCLLKIKSQVIIEGVEGIRLWGFTNEIYSEVTCKEELKAFIDWMSLSEKRKEYRIIIKEIECIVGGC